MMHETPEDNMFTNLLGGYSAPIADNGFSANLLAEVQMQAQEAVLEKAQTSQRLKNYMVGGAAIVGGAVAVLQLPALWTYLKGLSVPALDVPSLDMGAVQTSLETPSYTLAAFAMIAVLFVWLAGSALFGDNL